MNTFSKLILLAISNGFLFSLPLITYAQSDTIPMPGIPKDSIPRGVSISPSSIRYAIKPGNSQSKKINIFNDTEYERTFEVKSIDYNAKDINRAAADSKTEENFKYGLTKWTYITPAVFTLKPREKMSVNVLIDIPVDKEHNHAAWSMIIVEEVKERQQLDVNPNAKAVALGIIPTMGFGIFVYQNPPGLKATEISLTGYKITDDKKIFNLKAKNIGEGIGFCTYYFEIMNVATGKIIKIPASQATILPGAEREFKIGLPPLPSGSYNAMVVLDYGSKEMVETAEIDFAVQ
jgi:P pilus assembly chaperone PapD